MSRTRVVVTGIGATTPLGGDAPTTWAALLEGRSGVRRVRGRLPRRHPDQDRRARPGRPVRGAGARRGPSARPLAPSSAWSRRWRPGPTPATG